MNYNIIQTAEWILNNRKGKAFINYPLQEIINELHYSATNLSGVITTDDTSITGVCTGKMNHDKHLYFVQNVLTTTPQAIRQMINFFNTAYPSYRLYGIRHGKEKFINRLGAIENKLSL